MRSFRYCYEVTTVMIVTLLGLDKMLHVMKFFAYVKLNMCGCNFFW